MSENKNSIETYLNEKVKEYLNTSSAFFQQIQSYQGAFQTVRKEVLDLKANQGEKGFPEAKEKLIKLQEMHHNMFLLDQSAKSLQGVLYEFNVMAIANNVKLDIPDDAKVYFEQVTSVSPHIFAVENGQPVMIQNDITSTLMEAIKSKAQSEEALKNIYKML